MATGNPRLRVLSEDTLIRLTDKLEIMGCVEDEGDLDASLGYRADLASAEIARALVETGRSLSYLHVLVEALGMRGARRGYLEGALVAGRLCSALAEDASSPADGTSPREQHP